MINAHVPRPLPEIEREQPQCFEQRPPQPCEPESESQESINRRMINILKNWEIKIQALDRGCVVTVGCKSIAFVSLEAAYKEIGRYIENPQLVATQHGFAEYL